MNWDFVVLSQQRVAPQFPFVETVSQRNRQAAQAVNRTVAQVDRTGLREVLGWTANLANFVSPTHTLSHDLIVEQEIV